MKCSLVARLICRDSSAGIHLQGFICRDSSESLQLALQYQALNGDSTGDSTVDSKITQSNWADKKKLQFNQEKKLRTLLDRRARRRRGAGGSACAGRCRSILILAPKPAGKSKDDLIFRRKLHRELNSVGGTKIKWPEIGK